MTGDMMLELQRRDAVIAELLRRVAALEQERRTDRLDPASIRPAGGRTGSNGVLPAAAAAPPPPPVPTPEPAPAPAPKGPTPGSLLVDEDAAERALERTLVATGGLLLPRGSIEIEPALAFVRREQPTPIFVGTGGNFFVANQRFRQNDYVAVLAARVGLPLDSQIEAAIPWRYADQSVNTSIGLDEVNSDDRSGQGLGDFRIAMAKVLTREKGWRPDVIARLGWNSGSGQKLDDDVPLGGGFQEVGGSITLTKRQDPLAFVASFGYDHPFSSNGVRPGRRLSAAARAILAVSPDTSLRVGLDQQSSDDLKVNGNRIDGTDTLQSSLSFGASTRLGRGVLLDLGVQLGLTDDTADYAVTVALPIRFDGPIF